MKGMHVKIEIAQRELGAGMLADTQESFLDDA